MGPTKHDFIENPRYTPESDEAAMHPILKVKDGLAVVRSFRNPDYEFQSFPVSRLALSREERTHCIWHESLIASYDRQPPPPAPVEPKQVNEYVVELNGAFLVETECRVQVKASSEFIARRKALVFLALKMQRVHNYDIGDTIRRLRKNPSLMLVRQMNV